MEDTLLATALNGKHLAKTRRERQKIEEKHIEKQKTKHVSLVKAGVDDHNEEEQTRKAVSKIILPSAQKILEKFNPFHTLGQNIIEKQHRYKKFVQ